MTGACDARGRAWADVGILGRERVSDATGIGSAAAPGACGAIGRRDLLNLAKELSGLDFRAEQGSGAKVANALTLNQISITHTISYYVHTSGACRGGQVGPASGGRGEGAAPAAARRRGVIRAPPAPAALRPPPPWQLSRAYTLKTLPGVRSPSEQSGNKTAARRGVKILKFSAATVTKGKLFQIGSIHRKVRKSSGSGRTKRRGVLLMRRRA
ncbi:hypothetical protein EVAR_83296_1 [Eumeta japonica]|uniref:Uncharacterized protein n=1 Tax=Eumeta variegata TaxID=151549 RepID=A0A4C2A5K9_EUMVA|nr:hypothetical protein EVAR_83296_1 [Eumeta japonica]